MTDTLKEYLILICIIVWCFMMVNMCEPIPAAAEQPDDVALWLARSCAGEAGFDSWHTGECSAIMYIYLKRTKVSKFNLLQVAKRYSAAIKQRADHPRPWLFNLERNDDQPRGYPKNMA